MWCYYHTLHFKLPKSDKTRTTPKVMAIQCLRGTDPEVRDSLHRLINSNYTDLYIRFVVDSPEDPTLPIVQDVVAETSRENVEFLVLPERQPNCSGKASAILFGTQELPENCEIVVNIDGDAMLFPDTVERLVTGMQDPSIGVAAGNRWYHPQSAQWGSLIRMAWNAYCLPVVSYCQIPWGGCMAMRSNDVVNPEFRKMLAAAFTDDSTIASFVRKGDRRVHYVSEATLLNTEEISLQGFMRFLLRQLITIRLNNSRRTAIFCYMLSLNIVVALTPVVLFMPGVLLREVAILAYAILMLTTSLGHPLGELNIRRVLKARDEEAPVWTVTQYLKLPVAAVAVNWLNIWYLVKVWIVKSITWRGITYRLGSRYSISIAHVEPMRELQTENISSE